MISRRNFLLTATLPSVGILAAQKVPGLKIGTMDGVLKLSGKPASVALAKKLGLAAVQVTLGKTEGASLPLEDKDLQNQFVTASKGHGIPLDATYLDMLHVNCLKNDSLASKWV